MKVELLVNLKTAEGVLEKGRIFTDPIPGDVWNEVNLNRPTVRIIVDTRGQAQEVVIPEPAPEPPVVELAPPPLKKKRGRKL